MTLRADMTLTELERDHIVIELRNRTALSRVNHTEAHEIFNMLDALGYALVKAPEAAPSAA